MYFSSFLSFEVNLMIGKKIILILFQISVLCLVFEMSVSNDNSDDSSSTANDEVFFSSKQNADGEGDFVKSPATDEIRQLNKKKLRK